MVKSAVIIVRRAMGSGIGYIENNHMIMTALYMGRDHEAHIEFRNHLADYGSDVLSIWDHYYDLINSANKGGIDDVMEQFQRIIREHR